MSGWHGVAQLIHVGDYNGRGETEPLPHFYQNLGEAEVRSTPKTAACVGRPRARAIHLYAWFSSVVVGRRPVRCGGLHVHALAGLPGIVYHHPNDLQWPARSDRVIAERSLTAKSALPVLSTVHNRTIVP